MVSQKVAESPNSSFPWKRESSVFGSYLPVYLDSRLRGNNFF
jgi:hypothetical protein